MNPDKHLFIIRRNSGSGGAEKVAERLASHFSSHFEVSRLWAGQPYQNQIIPGKKGPPWWRSWLYTRYIDRLSIKQKNTVAYSLEYGPDCDIYRAGDGIHKLNVLRRYGKNPLWMVNPWHWLAPVLEKKCMENARYIIANSNLVKSHIVQTYPYLENKIITIYNGYDPSLFKPLTGSRQTLRKKLNIPDNTAKIILLSGSGFLRKGLHHAIKVVKQLHEQGNPAYLLVAGKGDHSYVDSMVQDYRLQKHIIYLGLIDNIADYYQASDCMLLLTRYDPFANACLEALACGCPVITSTNNGVAEIMDNDSGLVVDLTHEQTIKLCSSHILSAQPDPQKISASVSHLSAENEKQAHLNVINRVFKEKNEL